jgi:hypothetical protein
LLATPGVDGEFPLRSTLIGQQIERRSRSQKDSETWGKVVIVFTGTTHWSGSQGVFTAVTYSFFNTKRLRDHILS